MAEELRKNDWIMAKLTKPEASFMDFYAHNIKPENTSIQSADFYKKNQKIRNHFIDSKTGKFDEKKFDEFYDNALTSYNYYASDEYDQDVNRFLVDEILVAPDNIFSASTNHYVGTDISLINSGQPSARESIHGVMNERITGSSKSIREIAQSQKVHDGKTGKKLDWTPEDKGGLFKGLLRPTIALATWKEDGQHVLNGKIIKHKKGDLKYNEFGKPYTETIPEGESHYGRDIVHYSDTLTKESSWWNKIDFFDSDGKDKSIFGSVMKMAFTIAPYVIAKGKTKKIIGGVGASWALSQAMPNFIKGFSDICNGDKDTWLEDKMESWSKFNTRFQRSQSDRARESNLINFENITSMVSDVFPQLAQQQSVALVGKLIKSNSALAQKVGSNMAMSYMALTSAADTYQQFKEAGASDRAAGIGMWATAGAYYGLQNVGYFKDALQKGTWLDPELNRAPVRAMAKSLNKRALEIGKNPNVKESRNFFKKVFKRTQDEIKKKDYHSFKTPYMQAMINEGIEETMEEITADIVKGLTEGAAALGFTRDVDFNWSFKDVMSRYITSFIGGAIGGGIFNWQNRRDLSSAHKGMQDRATNDWDWQDEIVYMLRQGKRKEINKYVDYLYKKGKLGNKNLSATQFKTVNSIGEGNTSVYMSPSSVTDNQNDYVYNVVNKYLDHLEQIISTEKLGLTTEKVMDIIRNWDWYSKLTPDEQYVELLRNIGVQSNILTDMDEVSNDIVKTRQELELAIKESQETKDSATDSEKKDATDTISKEANIQELTDKLEELRKKRDEIVSGKRNKEYLGQAVWAMHSDLSSHFSNLSIEQFAKAKYNEVYQNLDPDGEKKKTIDEEYDKWVKNEKKQLFRSFDIYKELAKRFKTNIEGNIKKQNPIYEDFTVYQDIKDTNDKIKELENRIPTLDQSSQEYVDANNQLGVLKAKLARLGNLSASEQFLLQFKENQGFDRSVNGGLGITVQQAFKQLSDNLKNLFNTNKQHDYSNQNNAEYQHFIDQARKIYNDDFIRAMFLRAFKLRDKTNLKDVLDKIVANADMDFNTVQGELDQLNDDDFDYTGWNTNDNVPLSKELLNSHNYDRTYINELIQLFNDIYLNNKYTTKDAIDNAIKEFVDVYNADMNEEINEDEVKSIFNSISGDLGISNAIDLIDIMDKTDSLGESTYRDLLRDIYISLGKDTAVSRVVLDSERHKYSTLFDINQYIIENSNVEEELNELLKFMEYVDLLIRGSYDGFNKFMVDFGISEAPQISEDNAKEYVKQAAMLHDEVEALLVLSAQHKNQRLRVQKDITQNMTPKFFRALFNGDVPETLKNEFGVDIRLLRQQAFDGTNIAFGNDDDFDSAITSENYDDFERGLQKFEKLFSDAFYKLSTNPNVFANKWYEAWKGRNLKSRLLTSLTKNPDEDVQDFDVFLYWTSIATLQYDTFYYKYRRSIEALSIAPLYGQEMAVKIAASMITNPQVFASLNKLIPRFLPPDSAGPEAKTYQENKYQCTNILFILGGAGTGKTTVIDRIIHDMFKTPEVGMANAALSQQQVNNLNKALNDNNKSYTLEELLKTVANFDPNNIVYDDNTKHFVYKMPNGGNDIYSINTTSLNLNTQHNILFIDEIGFCNEVMIKALDKWAAQNGWFIIASGDDKQPGAYLSHNGKTAENGLSDVLFWRTPILTASMRTSNIAKVENFNNLEAMLGIVMHKYREEPWVGKTAMNNLLNNQFLNQGIPMKYYVTKEKDDVFGEYKVDNSDEAIDMIDKLKKKGKVAVVSKEAIYKGLTDVSIFNPKNVQGGEFDYIVIDIDWINEFGNGLNIDDKLAVIKMFYMLTQRSTKGTILVDKNNVLTNNFKIQWEQDANGANEFSLTKDAIDEYKKWRMDLMPNVANDSSWNFIDANASTYDRKFIEDYFANHPEVIDGMSQPDIDKWIDNILNGDTTGANGGLTWTDFDDIVRGMGVTYVTDNGTSGIGSAASSAKPMPNWYNDISAVRDHPSYAIKFDNSKEDYKWLCKNRYYRVFDKNDPNKIIRYGINSNLWRVFNYDNDVNFAISIAANPATIQHVDLALMQTLLDRLTDTTKWAATEAGINTEIQNALDYLNEINDSYSIDQQQQLIEFVAHRVLDYLTIKKVLNSLKHPGNLNALKQWYNDEQSNTGTVLPLNISNVDDKLSGNEIEAVDKAFRDLETKKAVSSVSGSAPISGIQSPTGGIPSGGKGGSGGKASTNKSGTSGGNPPGGKGSAGGNSSSYKFPSGTEAPDWYIEQDDNDMNKIMAMNHKGPNVSLQPGEKMELYYYGRVYRIVQPSTGNFRSVGWNKENSMFPSDILESHELMAVMLCLHPETIDASELNIVSDLLDILNDVNKFNDKLNDIDKSIDQFIKLGQDITNKYTQEEASKLLNFLYQHILNGIVLKKILNHLHEQSNLKTLNTWYNTEKSNKTIKTPLNLSQIDDSLNQYDFLPISNCRDVAKHAYDSELMPEWYDKDADNTMNSLADQLTPPISLRSNENINWNLRNRYYVISKTDLSGIQIVKYGLNPYLKIVTWNKFEPIEKLIVDIVVRPGTINHGSLNDLKSLLDILNDPQKYNDTIDDIIDVINEWIDAGSDIDNSYNGEDANKLSEYVQHNILDCITLLKALKHLHDTNNLTALNQWYNNESNNTSTTVTPLKLSDFDDTLSQEEYQYLLDFRQNVKDVRTTDDGNQDEEEDEDNDNDGNDGENGGDENGDNDSDMGDDEGGDQPQGNGAGKQIPNIDPSKVELRNKCSKYLWLSEERNKYVASNNIPVVDMDSDIFWNYINQPGLVDSGNDMSLRKVFNINVSDSDYAQLIYMIRSYILFDNNPYNKFDPQHRNISYTIKNSGTELLIKLKRISHGNIKYLLIENNDQITRQLGLSEGKIVYACIEIGNDKIKVPIGFCQNTPTEYAIPYNNNILYQVSSVDYPNNTGIKHEKLINLKNNPKYRIADIGIVISNRHNDQIRFNRNIQKDDGLHSQAEDFINKYTGKAFIGICDDKYSNNINDLMNLVYNSNGELEEIVDPRRIRLASIQRKMPLKDLIRLQSALYNIIRNPSSFYSAKSGNKKQYSVEILEKVKNSDQDYIWLKDLLDKYLEDYNIEEAIQGPSRYTYERKFDLLNTRRTGRVENALFDLFVLTKNDNTKNIINRGFNNLLTNFAVDTNLKRVPETQDRCIYITYKQDDNKDNDIKIRVKYKMMKDPSNASKEVLSLQYYKIDANKTETLIHTNTYDPWNFNLKDFINIIGNNGIPVNANTLDKISMSVSISHFISKGNGGNWVPENSNVVTGALFQNIIPDSQGIDRFRKSSPHTQPLTDAEYDNFLNELETLTNFKYGIFTNINIADTTSQQAAMHFDANRYGELYVALPDETVLSMFDINVSKNIISDPSINEWRQNKSSITVGGKGGTPATGTKSKTNTTKTGNGGGNIEPTMSKSDIMSVIDRFYNDNPQYKHSSFELQEAKNSINNLQFDNVNESDLRSHLDIWLKNTCITYNITSNGNKLELELNIDLNKRKIHKNMINDFLAYIFPNWDSNERNNYAGWLHYKTCSNDIRNLINLIYNNFKTKTFDMQNKLILDNSDNQLYYIKGIYKYKLDNQNTKIINSLSDMINFADKTKQNINANDAKIIVERYLTNNSIGGDTINNILNKIDDSKVNIQYLKDSNGKEYVPYNITLNDQQIELHIYGDNNIVAINTVAEIKINNSIDDIKKLLLSIAENSGSFDEKELRQLKNKLTNNNIQKHIIDGEDCNIPLISDLLDILSDDDKIKINNLADNASNSSEKKCSTTPEINLADFIRKNNNVILQL